LRSQDLDGWLVVRRPVNSIVMSLIVIPTRWNLRWPFTSVGVLFSIVYGLLSLAIIPTCGLGTGILIITAFGPYGIGFLFWPVIAFVLADLETIVAKSLVVVLLVCHYSFVYLAVNRGGFEEWQRITETIRLYPQYMWPPIVLYIIAHVLIWGLFVRGLFFSRQVANITNRWTGAAVARFASSLARRRLNEIAPPGQLRRWVAHLLFRGT
jgi:hypothetical protein